MLHWNRALIFGVVALLVIVSAFGGGWTWSLVA
jgi:hypothetical protein